MHKAITKYIKERVRGGKKGRRERGKEGDEVGRKAEEEEREQQILSVGFNLLRVQ